VERRRQLRRKELEAQKRFHGSLYVSVLSVRSAPPHDSWVRTGFKVDKPITGAGAGARSRRKRSNLLPSSCRSRCRELRPRTRPPHAGPRPSRVAPPRADPRQRPASRVCV